MSKPAAPARQSARDGDTVADSVDLVAWRHRHELRRSNAARPHANRKRYTRKRKHAARGYGDVQ